MFLPLAVVEINEGWLGALAAGIVLVIGSVGAVLMNLKNANNTLAVKLAELQQGGKAAGDAADLKADAARYEQFQDQLKTATLRITHLEEVNDRNAAEIRECHADRAALSERVRWLELNPGKSPPQSGQFRPVAGTESADL